MKSIAGNFEKFIEIFKFARQNSKFYSDHYRDIETIDLDSLQSIPATSRDSFYQFSPPENTDMMTGPMKGGYFTRSGGTSGKEKYAFTTYGEVQTGAKLLGNMLCLNGIDKDDIVANLFMPGHMYSAFSSISISLNHTGCVQLPIGANCEPDEILRYLLSFNPNVILAVPSLLMGLANLVESNNLPLKVEKLGYAGEHLNESSRDYLKKILGVKSIFSLGYAAVDTGIIGYQDKTCHGSIHKIPTDHVMVEIIDPKTNKHVELGEEGEIIVTNLFRKRIPVIRYHVGDRGILTKDGEDFSLKLLGRAGNNIMICGYEVSLSVFARILSKFDIDSSYQLVIDAEGPRIKITINYESPTEQKEFNPDFLKNSLIESSEVFAKMFDADILLPLDICWSKPGTLEKNQASGKMKTVIDKRS
ncbi:phenylacetate--CoA ligase family protein [bacterium]|nr:phenylacetate--CoA ligase family protein [bacterium]